MTAALLHADGVRRSLGRAADCFEVTIERLTLRAHDRIAIVGPSGCGKSTILALLGLALRPDAGTAFTVAGMDVREMWVHRRHDVIGSLRAKMIGFVPQTAGLLPFLTLRANIALPLALRRRPDSARVADLAAALGIGAALDRRPADASVGERQRAVVARAVVHRPVILLADEPTASVHPAQAEATLALLLAEAEEAQAAVLVATHDSALAEAAGLTVVPVRTAALGVGSRIAWPC